MAAFQWGDIVEHHILVGFSPCIVRESKCRSETLPVLCLLPFFFSLPKLKAICQTLFFFVYFTRSALNKCMIYALGWNLEIALRPLESSFLQTKEAFKPFCLIASRYRMIQESNPYSLLLLLWWESAQHSTGGSQLFGFFILFWCFYPIFHLSLHLILRYISSSWK